MKEFFFPESVAIYGVSAAPGNIGIGVLENLERFSFKGNVFLVGEKGGSVKRRNIVKNIDEIESTPDVAVFIIPATGIPDKLDECGKKGVRYAIIESGGFSEFGTEKESLEKEILRIATKWGIKILGPNCLGTINLENGFVAPFVPFHQSLMKKGAVSLISQSGGLLHDILVLLSCENLGINKLVSAGNKLMLNENDFLEYLISDPATKSIGIYLEDIRDGRRLTQLAATTDKPIVLLKSNVGTGSSHIAQFHTTALAGDDFLAESFLRKAGVYRVQNLAEMINALKIFSLPLMKGQRLAVITRSGGHAVLAADAVYHHGFKLAEFSQDIFDLVAQKKRVDVIKTTNPIDLGDIFDIDFHFTILERTLHEEGVDGALFIHAYDRKSDGGATLAFIKKINTLVRTQTKPVLFCMLSEKEDWFLMKDAAYFPVFSEADQAIKALAVSWGHFKRTANLKAPKIRPRKDLLKAKSSPYSRTLFLSPDKAFELLRQYALPVADFDVARNFKECRNAARRFGYPIALKTASPQTMHKTEKGAVRLNVTSDASLKEAVNGIGAETYIVQKMAQTGYELIIGSKRDPAFGQVIIFGMGGIYAELLKDISVRMIPVSEKAALKMISEIKGAAILKGYRGKPACDLREIARCIVRISHLLFDYPEIVNLDINPLITYEKGKGCVIVDAKIEAIVAPIH
jgi:acetyltransferase